MNITKSTIQQNNLNYFVKKRFLWIFFKDFENQTLLFI